MHVEAIYIAPVKSLCVQSVERAYVTKRGLAGDREFFIVNDRDRLVTMREVGVLATIRASYQDDFDLLRLELPDGRAFEAAPVPGQPLTARFFGKYDVAAFEVEGPWDRILSDFTGMAVRLVRAGARSGVDAFPVSLLSSASIGALRSSSGESSFEARRFRPNILIAGAAHPHQEDEWIDGAVRIGDATIRVRMRDERCAMTTLNPDTGVRDFNTLRMITAARPDQPDAVNFGVYATVDQEGEIVVGDEVNPAQA